MIVECQRHDDYQESIQWLLGFLEEYSSHAKTAADQGSQSHDAMRSDPALQQSLTEIRTLLERFANGKSFNDITARVNDLYDDANADHELRDWFKQLDAFARRCLLEPGYVLDDAANSEGNRLRDTGRQFYDGKYKTHFDAVFGAIGDFFTAMGDDPVNQRFGQDWARLTKDLLFDSEGSLKFKPELWNDVRKIILPSVIDRVGYIPIPRVEYTDDNLDLVIENLTLSGRNLFPNFVTMEAHNFIKFSPYNNIGDEHHHELTLHFGQVQADMRDVAFYFNKKSGFPKIKDSGLADVVLGGNGLAVRNLLTYRDDDTNDDMMSSIGHCAPNFRGEGQVVRLPREGRERQGRHIEVQHPGQQARRALQHAPPTCDRSSEEADPESDPGCYHHWSRVRRWTARRCA